jgi:hypothetical protein
MEISKYQTKPTTAQAELKRIEATRTEKKRTEPTPDQQQSAKLEAQKRQPVVNAQGQTTGRLLNVTA